MSDTTSLRILIMDDDDAIRTLLSRICSRRGFECGSAEAGAEALAKLAAAVQGYAAAHCCLAGARRHYL